MRCGGSTIGPGGCAGGRQREVHLLHARRIADAGIRAALRRGLQHDRAGPARARGSGTRTTTRPRYVSTSPKNASCLRTPARQRRARRRRRRPACVERELVAVEVVAIGDVEAHFDGRGVERRAPRTGTPAPAAAASARRSAARPEGHAASSTATSPTMPTTQRIPRERGGGVSAHAFPRRSRRDSRPRPRVTGTATISGSS